MVSLCGVVTALMLSLNATPLVGSKWLYGLWILLINGVTPGTYILLPKAVGLHLGIPNREVPLYYSLLFSNFVSLCFCIEAYFSYIT